MRKFSIVTAAVMLPVIFSGCGQNTAESRPAAESTENVSAQDSSTQLSYAQCFSLSEMDGCTRIDIAQEGSYLVVPQGVEVPADAPQDCTILQQPLDHVYMAATSAMDLVCAADAGSHVTFSSLEEDDWYVDAARQAMKDGTMAYAGSYSKPDYEMLLSGGCDLAVENTMIYHAPQVKEKIEELGIPVLVERSSYEPDPLGRLEWVKVYGVLFGTEDAAQQFYDGELSRIEPLLGQESTGKTAVFFSVTSDGAVTVHKPGGYMAKMIEYGGGEYALQDTDVPQSDVSARSTIRMQMEDFYNVAGDADILIYNSAIEGEIGSMDDLIAKDAIFEDFAAVRSGQVYCTGADFFQCVTKSCDFILDVHQIVTGADTDGLQTMEQLH